jgi:PhoPQ-activated pathogenicity-related protein
MSEVLSCFLQHNDSAYRYEFVSTDTSKPNITIATYVLHSQKWPTKHYANIPTTTWKHKLIFYIPGQISHQKALLYVNGGYNRSKEGEDKFFSAKEYIDYANIAINNKAPVIELEDVPNQFLFFGNSPKKEDQIIAYTYKMVMDNPLQNAYLAGHLPMAKSIVKAMDAAQEILTQNYDIDTTEFVLSGASKRGWAVWLASLEDKRVVAIIPIVLNILNAKKSIIHICKSYGGTCPPAFKDFEEENITNNVHTPSFADLMKIEDPFSYLGNDYDKKYKKRLAIPKYIINASGDDFFVPDSSRWYFKGLPGNKNYIRYLPNTMHYLMGNSLSDSTNNSQIINGALNSYFYFFLNNLSLPKINWKLLPDKIEFISSLKPKKIKLWSCNNERARDFRFITSYSRLHLLRKKIISIFFDNVCDNCYTEKIINFACEENTPCKVTIPLTSFNKGWQASFVEAHYDINHVPFISTTEVNIVPDTMPTTLDEQKL